MSEGRFDVRLEDIPGAFEGIIPSAIATVGDDGWPNVTFLSVVQRLDPTHVALSRQFFRKTDENTARNPYAEVEVVDATSRRMFSLSLVYERTETSGPVFERMRTKLDAVAAAEGMTNVFTLKGIDICRVESCRMVPCDFPAEQVRRAVDLERVEEVSRRLADAGDMEELLRTTLEACERLLGYPHVFVMLLDETRERLYTVASHGFPASGAGSEVRVGEGLIGLVAARRQVVRLTNVTRDLNYTHASLEGSPGDGGENVIPLPRLHAMRSQLIVPMLAHRELVGVLCMQSEEAGAFQASDECVASIIASQVALAMSTLRSPEPVEPVEAKPAPLRPLQVKYYVEDDSVFLDNEYLIKGVAGGILWRLLRDYQLEQRSEFSNKEIRLDPTLELPDIKDNLEARLILLRKRLEERNDAIRIEKVARGRFRLVVTRPLQLLAMEGGGPL